MKSPGKKLLAAAAMTLAAVCAVGCGSHPNSASDPMPTQEASSVSEPSAETTENRTAEEVPTETGTISFGEATSVQPAYSGPAEGSKE